MYNQKILSIIIILLLIFSSSLFSNLIPIAKADSAKKYDIPNKSSGIITLNVKTPKGMKTMQLVVDKLFFNVIPHYDGNGNFKSLTMTPKPDLNSLYKRVGYSIKSEKIVFVYPIFTQAAYGDKGFYDYYNKKCDTACLTVSIPNKIQGTYSSSISTAFALTLLNYSHITDIDIDKNPDILKKYDKIIILHNEYVTQKEFDAITHHPNVVYLFPNALYAKVKTDYQQGTITLVRGHGYPDKTIANGFGWKNDNSQYEYDFHCDNWKFYNVDNGKMLNCYPSFRALYDESLLQAIKN